MKSIHTELILEQNRETHKYTETSSTHRQPDQSSYLQATWNKQRIWVTCEAAEVSKTPLASPRCHRNALTSKTLCNPLGAAKFKICDATGVYSTGEPSDRVYDPLGRCYGGSGRPYVIETSPSTCFYIKESPIKCSTRSTTLRS